jgi:hypothetical protein
MMITYNNTFNFLTDREKNAERHSIDNILSSNKPESSIGKQWTLNALIIDIRYGCPASYKLLIDLLSINSRIYQINCFTHIICIVVFHRI